MAYKVTISDGTISDGTILEKSIDSVTFNADTPSDNFYEMRTYTINSMTITGRIGAGEKTISLYEWALLPANNPKCYKEIEVEQAHAGEVIRKVKFSMAFVVDYSESFAKQEGVGDFSILVRQLSEIDIDVTSQSPQGAVIDSKSEAIIEKEIVPIVAQEASAIVTTKKPEGRMSITDRIATQKKIQDNNGIPSIEDRQAIQTRIDDIKNVMTEEEKKRTTYGVALVKAKDGNKEMWISSAGQKGFIRTDIRGNDKVVKNKLPEGDNINRLNDAEQSLMREAEAQGSEILAMGATRDMCPACQEVANKKGILGRMVTPLKK
jgi:hypothetical protein